MLLDSVESKLSRHSHLSLENRPGRSGGIGSPGGWGSDEGKARRMGLFQDNKKPKLYYENAKIESGHRGCRGGR